MYAHRVIQPLNGLRLQLDLPPEFSGCQEAEIIVLPVQATTPASISWEQRVLSLAGTLGDDFTDDMTDTGEEVSPLYKALMKIGFIGCIDTDEQLSTRYKDEIDFSNKHGEKP